eukprot:229501_1
MSDITKVLTVIYVSIQVSIALFVSVVGALHVRRSIQAYTSTEPSNTKATPDAIDEPKDADNNPHSDTDTKITMNIEEETNNIKQKGFCGSWVKIVWKMRSVYSSLAVHSFDVLTDVLVIIQWLNAEKPGDHIDPQIMAYCAIAVIAFSRVFSAIAIFVKERNLMRALLQLFDLLIFQEIYESHHKIVSQFKNKQLKDKKHPIESTLSFKYVRNMEAIFESVPEAVLQLVYVLRVGTTKLTNREIIFIISIVQSMVSMSNSILNNDYTRMQDEFDGEWAKYKQRLPPTFEFFKHAICRISEVIYRIGLLALFWTVCGGWAFGVLLFVELVLICLRTGVMLEWEYYTFDADTVLLAISSIIVIPSEDVYGIAGAPWHAFCGSAFLDPDDRDAAECVVVLFANICCCLGPASFLAAISFLCKDDHDHYISLPPAIRIGTSLYEIILLVIWAFVVDDGSRKHFLLDEEHGLVVFVVTCVCFLIFSQYRVLFPDFSLILDVSVRSKWGYAYSNELTELQKINVPLKKMPYKVVRQTRGGDEQEVEFNITSKADFWDEPYTYTENKTGITAAMFALAKGNHDIVQWLEARGAVAHKNVDIDALAKGDHDLVLWFDSL